MLKISFLITLLISFVFADVADYLKSAKRTFNEIEGKVPKISVEMDPQEYNRLVEMAQINQEEDIIIGCMGDASKLPDFETKVTLTYELEGDKKVFKKVTFKTGGNYSRSHDRIGFNFKLKGDDLLFNRKQIRVRPDAPDNTHLKSKIAYDLLNNWGLPSIQEVFCEFYINDEYFGLYVLQDTIKVNWINKVYGIPADKEVETLFYCRNDNSRLINGNECLNQNDKVSNYTEPFEELVQKIKVSESIKDLEKFMNVDLLMKNIAIEFLFGSFDHFLVSGHNFYMYQKMDGIWDMILVDFDAEFGNSLYVYFKFVLNEDIEDYGYRLKIENMVRSNNKLIEVAYTKDKSYFKKALRELMVTGFNPDALFKRIDELKEFIAPYVKKATTPRADGRLPGVINLKAVSNIENTNPMVPSLKSWIQNRFEFACEEYDFDMEEILKEAAEYRGEEYIPKQNEKETEVEEECETETTTEIVEEDCETTSLDNVEDSAEDVEISISNEDVEESDEEDSIDEVEVSLSIENEEDSADEL
ncbi:hypothetical protein PIROE2DRAFT_4038 [Piromyces sp. E2]|nr:hypothetical protein PIROE2DRAFT_4038 [Piromyces sp. E2]|eukprot:OUM68292.1 hypothetical protein PIROE2DRAFT_4038 [Piromyces sp. E2]